MNKRRDFLKLTGMAGIGLASMNIFELNATGLYNILSRTSQNVGERKVFIEAGKPVAVMGSGIKDMYREGNELVIPSDESWGNAVFANLALMEKDFHIHARLILDKLAGTGASFLIGGHYHYPCSRPEGNRGLRVSLDDNLEIYKGNELGTEERIVYGRTIYRAPWYEAEKEVAGKVSDYIKPGEPFDLDLFQKGEIFSFQINGQEVFQTSLRGEEIIYGHGDAGWPASFGFFPDRGVIRLHEFWAEGSFTSEAVEHTDVWMMGHDGYFTYRIPSLCVTPGGSILAFAEARRSDWLRWDWRSRNADEVHCVMKRSTDGGKTWSGQKKILGEGSGYEARDPHPLVCEETGDIFLLLSGPYIMKSKDEGETWSEPRSLKGVLLRGASGENLDRFVPGTVIKVYSGKYKGRLIASGYTECGCALIYSDDHGTKWKLGAMTRENNAYEPTIIELEDGRILMNSRQHTGNPGRLISISNDGGDSFYKEYYDEQLTMTTVLASIIRYDWPGDSAAGKRKPVMFVGPAQPKGRRNLTVRLSYDECESWPVSSPVIYSGHSGYSAIEVLPDGQIGVLYEKDAYRSLSFVRFPLDWVTG